MISSNTSSSLVHGAHFSIKPRDESEDSSSVQKAPEGVRVSSGASLGLQGIPLGHETVQRVDFEDDDIDGQDKEFGEARSASGMILDTKHTLQRPKSDESGARVTRLHLDGGHGDDIPPLEHDDGELVPPPTQLTEEMLMDPSSHFTIPQSNWDKLKIGAYHGSQVLIRDGVAQMSGQALAAMLRGSMGKLAASSMPLGPWVVGGAAVVVIGGASYFWTSRATQLLEQGVLKKEDGYSKGLHTMLVALPPTMAIGSALVGGGGSLDKTVKLLSASAGRIVGQLVRDTVAQFQGGVSGTVKVREADRKAISYLTAITDFDPKRLTIASAVYAGLSVGHQLGTTPAFEKLMHSDGKAAGLWDRCWSFAGGGVSSALLEALDGLNGSVAAALEACRSGRELEYFQGGGLGKIADNLRNASGVLARVKDHTGMRMTFGATVSDAMNALAQHYEAGSEGWKVAKTFQGLVNGVTELRGWLVERGQAPETQVKGTLGETSVRIAVPKDMYDDSMRDLLHGIDGVFGNPGGTFEADTGGTQVPAKDDKSIYPAWLRDHEREVDAPVEEFEMVALSTGKGNLDKIEVGTKFMIGAVEVECAEVRRSNLDRKGDQAGAVVTVIVQTAKPEDGLKSLAHAYESADGMYQYTIGADVLGEQRILFGSSPA